MQNPDNWKYWACNHSETADQVHTYVEYTCEHEYTMCQRCYEAYGKCPIKRDGGEQILLIHVADRPPPLPGTVFKPAIRP